MASSIEDIRLKVTDNGFILCYTEKSPRPYQKGMSYPEYNYQYKELVYEDENAHEAIEKMMELRDSAHGTTHTDMPLKAYKG